MPKFTTTATRTVRGMRWECNEADGWWYCGPFTILRSGMRGRLSEWILMKNNQIIEYSKRCTDLMDSAAARSGQPL